MTPEEHNLLAQLIAKWAIIGYFVLGACLAWPLTKLHREPSRDLTIGDLVLCFFMWPMILIPWLFNRISDIVIVPKDKEFRDKEIADKVKWRMDP